MEPELKVELTARKHGHIGVKISITPRMAEEHSYDDEIDQTYLPAIVASCRSILETYPVRGDPRD
jgi:hypothetical protein